MSHFRSKVLLFAAVAVIFTRELKLAEALSCFQCAGYDRVENQCSPGNDGQSIECSGPHPVCELIEETYPSDSTLHRHFYYLRKCGQQPNFEGNVSTCAPQETIASTLVTRCYCNTNTDCNKGLINGKGSMKDVIREATKPNDWEFLLAKNASTDSANETDSSSPLKCWECSGYNRVTHECSQDNRGKLVECPGPNAVCELVEEVDTSWTLSRHAYISRKCGNLDNLDNSSDATKTSGTCEDTTIDIRRHDQWNITRCYCNNWDECNFGGIAGIGEPTGENLNFIEGEAVEKKGVMQSNEGFVNFFRNNFEMVRLLPKSCQALLNTSDDNSRGSVNVNFIIVCLRKLAYEKVVYLNRLWPSARLSELKEKFGL